MFYHVGRFGKIGWDNAVAKWKKDREYLIGKKLDKTVKVAEIIK